MDQSENGVLEFLAEYRDTLALAPSCAQEIQNAEEKLAGRERALAKVPLSIVVLACANATVAYGECLKAFAEVWKNIDPHCASVYDAELDGTHQSNACMAGESIMTPNLVRDDPDQVFMDQFLNRLRSAIASAAEGATFEWLSLTNGADKYQQMKLFRMVANFYIAGNSFLGYLDDYAEAVWRDSIGLGALPTLALERYHGFKNKLDQFYNLKQDMRKKHLKLTFAGEDVTNANHHTYISAVISCRYQDEGKAFASALPAFLSLLYEGKDYVANIHDGWAWHTANAKIKIDMKRTRAGARLGFDFCHEQGERL